LFPISFACFSYQMLLFRFFSCCFQFPIVDIFNCFDWFSIVQLFDFSDCCFFHFQFFDPFLPISTVFQSFSCFDCAASILLIFSVSPFFHLSFFRIFCAFNLWEFNCCLFHQLFQSFQCLHLFDHLNCLHVSFIVSFILFRHFSIVSIHSFNHFICCSFSIVSIPCDRSSTLLSSSWIVDSDMSLVNECGIPQMWGASG